MGTVDGPFPRLLPGRGPFRRAEQRHVSVAVEQTWPAAGMVIDVDGTQQPATPDKIEQWIATARLEGRPPPVASDKKTKSNLFCCTDCTPLWLFSTEAVAVTVRHMTGPRRDECKDKTRVAYVAVEVSVLGPPDVGLVVRPTRQVAGLEQRMPEEASSRADIGAAFVAELVRGDPEAAVAEAAASKARELLDSTDRVMPDGTCVVLSSIADALDSVPKVFSNCIVYAIELLGVPAFPANVIGSVVTHLTLHPLTLTLHALAQAIRAVGVVSCAATDHLGECQCARALVGDLLEAEVTAKLRQALDAAIKAAGPTVGDRQHPRGPVISLQREVMLRNLERHSQPGGQIGDIGWP